jgi:hypothetical protein
MKLGAGLGVSMAEAEQAVMRWSTPEKCVQWIFENRDGLLRDLPATSSTNVPEQAPSGGPVSQAYPQQVRLLPDFAAIAEIHAQVSGLGLTLNQVLQGFYRGHKTAERCINWVLEYERASNEPFDVFARLAPALSEREGRLLLELLESGTGRAEAEQRYVRFACMSLMCYMAILAMM